ncbi:uncharacterized protein LOC143228240 [Tachypleus tridentatus]|uniref:uncharacterized protein LOC143228240 n=1 Tax=Tachypleus tridentatus TaxID=6853 RepID=UPI003FD17041
MILSCQKRKLSMKKLNTLGRKAEFVKAKRHDQDRDGLLDLYELSVMLENLGIFASKSDIQKLITAADEDHDMKLSLREFLIMWQSIATNKDNLKNSLAAKLSDVMKEEELIPLSTDVTSKEVLDVKNQHNIKSENSESYDEKLGHLRRLQRLKLSADKRRRKDGLTEKEDCNESNEQREEGIDQPEPGPSKCGSWYSQRRSSRVFNQREEAVRKAMWIGINRELFEGTGLSSDESSRIAAWLALQEEQIDKPVVPLDDSNKRTVSQMCAIFEGVVSDKKKEYEKSVFLDVHRSILERAGLPKTEVDRSAPRIAAQPSCLPSDKRVRRAVWLAIHRDLLDRNVSPTHEAARKAAWVSISREIFCKNTTPKIKRNS